LVGIEQDASGQAKTKLARTGTGAVKQLHVLAAASLAGFEVITDGRFCGDHRGVPVRRTERAAWRIESALSVDATLTDLSKSESNHYEML
jgi:hypothetical protein